MTRVEDVKVEADEDGFELHLIVDDDVIVSDDGRLILNVQAVAEQLHEQVVRMIGPWLAEGEEARRDFTAAEMERIVAEEERLAAGETVMDFYRRTGNPEPLLEQADDIRARAKEGA